MHKEMRSKLIGKAQNRIVRNFFPRPTYISGQKLHDAKLEKLQTILTELITETEAIVLEEARKHISKITKIIGAKSIIAIAPHDREEIKERLLDSIERLKDKYYTKQESRTALNNYYSFINELKDIIERSIT